MKPEDDAGGCRPGRPATAQASLELWNGRLGNNPDESSVGCAGFGREYNRWLYRLRARVFRRVAGHLQGVTKDPRVLDAGSGTGFYIDQWRRLGVRRIEGLDFSPAGIENLRQRYPDVPLHLADIAEDGLDLGEGTYDVISAFDVLFHIVDDDRYHQAMQNLARALRPGGILLFSENFVHHERPRVSDYHYSRSLTAIERLVEAAGMTLENRYPMFVLMNAPDDAAHPAMAQWWRIVTAVAQRGERLGWLAGASLFPVDLALTRMLREGPSTELAVCRRREIRSHPGAA